MPAPSPPISPESATPAPASPDATSPATPRAPLNPSALSVEDLAALLTGAAGSRVSVEMVQEDLNAGAPVGADGRINLVHYAAWLAREVTE